jgi:hypothetical protein
MAIYHFYKGGKKTFFRLPCHWRKAQLTPLAQSTAHAFGAKALGSLAIDHS